MLAQEIEDLDRRTMLKYVQEKVDDALILPCCQGKKQAENCASCDFNILNGIVNIR